MIIVENYKLDLINIWKVTYVIGTSSIKHFKKGLFNNVLVPEFDSHPENVPETENVISVWTYHVRGIIHFM